MSANDSSNDTITLGNGDGDTVNNSNEFGSTNDTIILGNGINDRVNAGQNDTITLGDGAGDTVTDSFARHDTITFGNVPGTR